MTTVCPLPVSASNLMWSVHLTRTFTFPACLLTHKNMEITCLNLPWLHAAGLPKETDGMKPATLYWLMICASSF